MSCEDPFDSAPGSVRVERLDAATVVVIEGEHDLATIDLVREAFEAAEASAPRLLVVDLAGCRFMDSTVLRALLLARERAQAAERRIVLVVDDGSAGRIVATLLRVTELDGVFETVRSRDEAVRRATEDT